MSLHRSLLFVPADNDRALAKAPALPADLFVLDLEDAVAPERKAAARARLAPLLQSLDPARVLLRCNASDSPWYSEDLQLAAGKQLAGLLLPKVDGPHSVLAAEQRLRESGDFDTPLWAMIETPLAVLHADEIAAATTRLRGFIAGFEDLRSALGAARTIDRSTISFSQQRILLAARAYGMLAIDSPYADFGDASGLAAQAAQAQALGYDGKACIHPGQLAAVNAQFSPSAEALSQAQALIAAWDAAQAAGKSVATLNGAMIEALHVRAASRVVQADRLVRQQL